MALTRRQLVIGVPLWLGAVACVGSARLQRALSTPYRELFSASGKPGSSTVLVCMPDTSQTREVWLGMSDELAKQFTLIAVQVDSRSNVDVIDQAIRRHRPSGLVLMNNPTVAAYREYLHRQHAVASLPAVVVMTSFLDDSQLQPIGAAGISYEVPLITVVTNLRRLLMSPIERVGVVYRARLAGFVHRELELARREQISLNEQKVGENPNESEIKRALRLAKKGASAIWILNDDRLLTPALITDAWLPGLQERPWLPTIVGAASLLSAGQSLGTFAALPDLTALGAQTANVVFDIAENGWILQAGTLAQLPLSTTTMIDAVQARERFALRENAFSQVDKIVE
jgi:hypothetical protein